MTIKSFTKVLVAGLAAIVLSSSTTSHAATVWLDELDLNLTSQDWGNPHKNQSVQGHPLTLAGKSYEHGLGTHAESSLMITAKGAGQSISGSVGIDDEEIGSKASVEFFIIADGKTVWKSGVKKAGQAATDFSVTLTGVTNLILKVGDANDGNSFDHADWADVKFEMSGDARPETINAPAEPELILTPAESPKPRINGAQIFGVRPNSPFLFTIAATGDRPMKFGATHLPAGLRLDQQTGRITGTIATPGTYEVTLRAKNALGSATRKFKIVCGDTIALTPPMGWNSWNCFAHAVSEDKVKSAAEAMAKSGLINHGWTYINVDDFWQNHRDSPDPTLHGDFRDAQGNIVPNSRFPDMKGMADFIHGLGLKAGLYSSPGPWTCGRCTGSYQHEQQDAEIYAKWGFDYLKYDLCTYSEVVPDVSRVLEKGQKPYREMGDYLRAQPRDIVFSLCQYGELDVWKWGASVGGNSWRTTGDIRDSWGSLSSIGFKQDKAAPFAGPGHWNDPDMLIVGKVGWGHLHPTHLSVNEQYLHISLWSLLSAPLLIGCDMTQLDAFTLNLLENDEVIAVDQDPLGKSAKTVASKGETRVYAKPLADGSHAVGLFNLSENEQTVSVAWSDLGLKGKLHVRDLWRQKDLGKFKDSYTAIVPRHGVVLVKVW